MKGEMIFMVAVLGMAGIHLLFSVVKFFAKFKAVPAKATDNSIGRDDWYVFFDRSVLLGKEDDGSVEPDSQPKDTIDSSTPAHGDHHTSQEVYA